MNLVCLKVSSRLYLTSLLLNNEPVFVCDFLEAGDTIKEAGWFLSSGTFGAKSLGVTQYEDLYFPSVEAAQVGMERLYANLVERLLGAIIPAPLRLGRPKDQNDHTPPVSVLVETDSSPNVSF